MKYKVGKKILRDNYLFVINTILRGVCHQPTAPESVRGGQGAQRDERHS